MLPRHDRGRFPAVPDHRFAMAAKLIDQSGDFGPIAKDIPRSALTAVTTHLIGQMTTVRNNHRHAANHQFKQNATAPDLIPRRVIQEYADVESADPSVVVRGGQHAGEHRDRRVGVIASGQVGCRFGNQIGPLIGRCLQRHGGLSRPQRRGHAIEQFTDRLTPLFRSRVPGQTAANRTGR